MTTKINKQEGKLEDTKSDINCMKVDIAETAVIVKGIEKSLSEILTIHNKAIVIHENQESSE